MQPTDWISIATSAAFGGVTGSLLGGMPFTISGAVIGVLFAYGAARARVRPTVATTLFVGAAAGALIGSSIVQTICLPDTCVGLEVMAGIIVGLGAMIGVGMVSALVARSFDEYNESVAQGRESPTAGCETGE